MLETNKQALLFNFGEDLSYFVILRYKLRDFIKIYDYVNDPTKGDFQKTLLRGYQMKPRGPPRDRVGDLPLWTARGVGNSLYNFPRK